MLQCWKLAESPALQAKRWFHNWKLTMVLGSKIIEIALSRKLADGG
jgi:hypothetical protein